MTIDQLIAQVRASVAANLAERDTHRASIETVRAACLADAGRDPSDAEAARCAPRRRSDRGAIDTAREMLTARITELETEKQRDEAAADKLSREFNPAAPKPKYDAVVNRGDTNEPRTYTRYADANGTASFFRDHYLAEAKQNRSARERIERHAPRCSCTGDDRARHDHRLVRRPDRAAVPRRPGGARRARWPAGRQHLHAAADPRAGHAVPDPARHDRRGDTRPGDGELRVQNTDEVWANVTVNVATIAGQQDVSRQSLERGTPGIDQLIYLDLAGAYGVNVDSRFCPARVRSGQVLGMFGTAGINQATAFGAAATPTTFYSKVAGQINAIETSRFLAPNDHRHAPAPLELARRAGRHRRAVRSSCRPRTARSTRSAVHERRPDTPRRRWPSAGCRAARRHRRVDPDRGRHRPRGPGARLPGAGPAALGGRRRDAARAAVRADAGQPADRQARRVRLHRVHRGPLPDLGRHRRRQRHRRLRPRRPTF
jgi:hypothetical protein